MVKMDNSELTPGMVLAQDVYDWKAGLLIVNAGVTLNNELIDKLQKYSKLEIYVADLSPVQQDEHEKHLWPKMAVSHQRALQRAKNIFDNAGEQPPDQELMDLMVSDLEEQIALSSNVLINLSYIKSYDDYLYSHVVNVAMLALIIGKELNLSQGEMHELGLAALLHDYGMVKVDHTFYDHNRSLSPQEWEQVKCHPMFGVELLQNADQLSPAVLQAILEHHERMDGSGYPEHKQGAELGLFGKIIAIADVYDACISKRKYRDPIEPHVTLKKMLSGTGLFDLEVLKAFVAAMAIYPIGSYVRLNTGEIGKVIGCNPKEPFRPDVQVYFDQKQQKISAPYRVKLNTQDNQQCFIAGCLEAEQLRIVRQLLGE